MKQLRFCRGPRSEFAVVSLLPSGCAGMGAVSTARVASIWRLTPRAIPDIDVCVCARVEPLGGQRQIGQERLGWGGIWSVVHRISKFCVSISEPWKFLEICVV